MRNSLFFGDNLHWLPKLDSKSVDLIYLDPPFNSKATYNLLYKSPNGEAAQAQYQAFVDSWRWGPPTDKAFSQVMKSGSQVAGIITAFHNYMNKSDLEAYLVMMSARLIEMHRVLKADGSLWLHCDSSASHYMKIILDAIFDAGSFKNEVIWKRTSSKSLMKKRLPTNHDVLLFYSGNDNFWSESDAFIPYNELALSEKTEQKYASKDSDGRRYQLDNLINPNSNRPNLEYEFLGVTRVWRWTKEKMQAAYDAGLVVQPAPGRVPRYKRYLDEQRGAPLDDVWVDIPPLNSQAAERLGYQTQKPLALLERIIRLSTKPGDLILDPFCGCGTAIEAAHKLKRRWIGIDITSLAIDVVSRRLAKQNVRNKRDYTITGTPLDLSGAQRLFTENHMQFQIWAVTLVDGQPRDRLGADKGVDGVIYYQENAKTINRAVVSVKGGTNIHANDIRELIGSARNSGGGIGIFVTLHPPTSAMKAAAAEAEAIEINDTLYPRIQIFTIKDLLDGKKPKLPLVHDIISTAASARRLSQKRDVPPQTPEDIRRQPSLKLPIEGGRKGDAQRDLGLDEPLLISGTTKVPRGRRRA